MALEDLRGGFRWRQRGGASRAEARRHQSPREVHRAGANIPIGDLVNDAIPALIEENRVLAYPYDGFWAPMDTLKDKQTLEGLVASGQAPWSSRTG